MKPKARKYLAEYVALAKNLGRTPTMDDCGPRLYSGVCRHFGNARRAALAAGLTPNVVGRKPEPKKPRIPRESIYTFEQAWNILCGIARELGYTPPVSEVPHSRAIVGALGCRNFTEAQELVGLTPNRSGPCVCHPLPEGWTGEIPRRGPVIVDGVNLDEERALHVERMRKKYAAETPHVRVPHVGRPRKRHPLATRSRWDDFVPPADLTKSTAAWWSREAA